MSRTLNAKIIKKVSFEKLRKFTVKRDIFFQFNITDNDILKTQ